MKTNILSSQTMPHKTIFTISDTLDYDVKQWLDSQDWSIQHFKNSQTFFEQADLTLPACVILQLNDSILRYAKLIQQLSNQNSPIIPVIIESRETLLPQKGRHVCESLNFVDLPVEIELLSQLIKSAFERAIEQQQCIEISAIYYDKFTLREFDIAQQLVNGKTVNEIAERLFLVPNTIEKYLERMRIKTNSTTLTALTKLLNKYPPSLDLPKNTHL
ncbi:helix-turn-helix transcriptional regulator [Pseudoalteromonas luteoviolacea]|nr:helix-turn-helix transcriptional regulator [Pseudoalteromonas luteoviolacea]